MKPGIYNLPPIYRGATYPKILFTWLDKDGNPIDVSLWRPLAKSLNIDLHPQIEDGPNGVTSISFTKAETAGFDLGVERWDWIWVKHNTPEIDTVSSPYLAGTVEIKESVTQITPTPT